MAALRRRLEGVATAVRMSAAREAVAALGTGRMRGPGGALETLRPGSVWIQTATVGLNWTERLATLADEHGIEFVDAPVSGSDGPARERQLVVLASGSDGTRAPVQPIFDAIGRRTPKRSGSTITSSSMRSPTDPWGRHTR